jgi:hypothetical protein
MLGTWIWLTYKLTHIVTTVLSVLFLTGTVKVNPLHSKHHADMVSVVCLVVTQQEGYLYYFTVHCKQEPSRLQQAACVTVYPFTAPVMAVAMESYVLHALTESGLETYTLRTGCQFASAVDLIKNTTGVSILCSWMCCAVLSSVLWSVSSAWCSKTYICRGTSVYSDPNLLFFSPWDNLWVYRQSFYHISLIQNAQSSTIYFLICKLIFLIEVPFCHIWCLCQLSSVPTMFCYPTTATTQLRLLYE